MPLGFQVQLNDETPIRAGDDAMSVLTAMVTYVASRHEIELRVGGLFASQSSGKNTWSGSSGSCGSVTGLS
jgi:hypothetical protein